MSHFYAKIEGARGEGTRTGTKASGLRTWAASWSGAVRVSLMHKDDTGEDWVRVDLVPWHGRGVTRELYVGRIDGEPEATARKAVAALAEPS